MSAARKPLPRDNPPAPHGARLVNDRTRTQFARGYWKPSRGVRLPEDEDSVIARCEALNLVAQRPVVFSSLTSVTLWEGVEDRSPDIEVTVGADDPLIQRPQVICRRRTIDDRDITRAKGLAVTTPQRTFVDVARLLSLPRLVAVGDDFVRRGLCTQADIEEVVQRLKGQRGVRRARQAIPLIDPRSESPRESIVRILLHERGFPAPTPQVNICDAQGQFIARGDLVYEKERIVIEYDGEHHLTRETQAKDASRRGKLAVNDWLIVTVVAEDVSHPERLAAKVQSARDARAARPVTPSVE